LSKEEEVFFSGFQARTIEREKRKNDADADGGGERRTHRRIFSTHKRIQNVFLTEQKEHQTIPSLQVSL